MFLVRLDLAAVLRAGKSPPGLSALPTGWQTLSTWHWLNPTSLTYLNTTLDLWLFHLPRSGFLPNWNLHKTWWKQWLLGAVPEAVVADLAARFKEIRFIFDLVYFTTYLTFFLLSKPIMSWLLFTWDFNHVSLQQGPAFLWLTCTSQSLDINSGVTFNLWSLLPDCGS